MFFFVSPKGLRARFLLRFEERVAFLINKLPTMIARIFGKPKQETNALATLDKLNEV